MNKKVFFVGVLLVVVLGLAGKVDILGNREKDTEKAGAVSVEQDEEDAVMEELKQGLDVQEMSSQKQDGQIEDASAVITEKEKALAVELIGVDEEMLDVLGVRGSDIAEALKEWADMNGYSGISGAAFYEPMWIRFSESKYSIGFELILGDTGNGVSANDSQMFTMDYYKSSGIYQFHK